MTSILLRSIVRVALFELHVAMRTRRALAVSALYVLGATLGALAVVTGLRAIEQQAVGLLQEQPGLDGVAARATLSLLAQPAYEQMVAFFAGVAQTELSPLVRDCVILPPLLWGTLAFLPFVIVLTSYDTLAQDVRTRTLCYAALRVSRQALVLGKLLAHAALFVTLLLVGMAVWYAIAAMLLSEVPLGAFVMGGARVTAVLVPFGLCYTALSVFCSSLQRQPFAALATAVGLIALLRAIAWTEYIPAEHALAVLRPLHFLSPAVYQSGLWHAGVLAPLQSAAAYVAMALVLVLLTLRRMERIDL